VSRAVGGGTVGMRWDHDRAAKRFEIAVSVPPSGADSRGPWSYVDAPYYISLLIIRTEYNKARRNDSTAHG
jgi:hypothetical protein